MTPPSKLRRAVAGLAVGGVVATGVFAIDATSASASTSAADPFGGFGDGFLGSGGDPGFSLPDPFGGGDPLGDIADDLLGGSDLTAPRTGSGSSGMSTGRTTISGFDLPTFAKDTLQKLGSQALKRWYDQKVGKAVSRDSRSYGSNDWYGRIRPGQQGQKCRPAAYVRLYGTTIRKGKLASDAFIGGRNLGKTLILGRDAFLALFGDKLKARSTANYFFVSRRNAESFSPQPQVAKNTVLEDRNRYSANFLDRGVTYTVLVKYVNTCNEQVVDVLGRIRRR
ncbi:hypothetical protein [Nonomuraea jiangxiensis]|uniref:Uncharacterized protein n=1 Tax=Nonomuraea jiangxiensis TaxID=633440 RepID=A0A1G9B8W5_9ACTN|nr:hypothetical protein [Nonomuraea jiangxiensis]SDK36016.1 hypothetical protein SAMN05421869_115195 [Nonomuraea jiangxiensis]